MPKMWREIAFVGGPKDGMHMHFEEAKRLSRLEAHTPIEPRDTWPTTLVFSETINDALGVVKIGVVVYQLSVAGTTYEAC